MFDELGLKLQPICCPAIPSRMVVLLKCWNDDPTLVLLVQSPFQEIQMTLLVKLERSCLKNSFFDVWLYVIHPRALHSIDLEDPLEKTLQQDCHFHYQELFVCRFLWIHFLNCFKFQSHLWPMCDGSRLPSHCVCVSLIS